MEKLPLVHELLDHSPEVVHTAGLHAFEQGGLIVDVSDGDGVAELLLQHRPVTLQSRITHRDAPCIFDLAHNRTPAFWHAMADAVWLFSAGVRVAPRRRP